MDERMRALEIKIAYQDDLLTQLNAIVIEQQRQLDALTRQAELLTREVKQLSGGSVAPSRTIQEDLPPHY